MTQYAILLRGINVGGKNKIKMTDLKACLEAAGLKNVLTYIQSGNVLVQSEVTAAELVQKTEAALSKTFNYKAKVVVCTHRQLRQIVKAAPKGFGTQPDKYRSDVIFLKDLKPADVLPLVATREGVDVVAAGPNVLYFSRLTSQATKSKLSRIVLLPAYQSMTIRTYTTTLHLLELMDEQAKNDTAHATRQSN